MARVRYILTVTTSPLSPDEIRAAAEIHRELGPEYDRSVVESFMDRLSVLVVWLAIAAINVAYALHARPPGQRR